LDWLNKTKEEKESAGRSLFSFADLFGPPSSATMKRLPLIFLLCTASCVSTDKTVEEAPRLIPGDPSAPSQVTPDEAMAIAQGYTNHSWRPFARNILHGKDKAGILVNTPDVSHEPQHERRGWWIPGEAFLTSGVVLMILRHLMPPSQMAAPAAMCPRLRNGVLTMLESASNRQAWTAQDLFRVV
jgi:hypothetical protein